MDDRSLPVSDHAVRRYIERTPELREVHDLAVAQFGGGVSDTRLILAICTTETGRQAIRHIRKVLGGPSVREVWEALGDGQFPVAGGHVRVRDGHVVTFLRWK